VIRASAAGIFDGPLRDAILKLKYGRRKPLAGPLGELLAAHIRKQPFWPETFDAVVPVPLHPDRERERGFNQAEMFALAVGQELALPAIDCVLIRNRKTKTQTTLSAAKRRENVKNAFAIRDSQSIQGKTLLLVDDVITTLATCDECARMLLEAGARAVYAVALAREE
jgi:ComF family protein